MKKPNHYSGLIARLNILKAIFVSNTTELTSILHSYLDSTNHVYSGVEANLDPLVLLNKISNINGKLDYHPDFSILAQYDFSRQLPDIPCDWVAEPEVSEFLAKLAYHLDAVNVIEVGCFIGVTSSYIAKSLAMLGGDRKLYCLDISQKFLDITVENMVSMGLQKHLVTHLITLEPIEDLKTLPTNVDLIYIDSSHTYEDTLLEIQEYSKRLSTKGCLVLHDSIQWPGVRRAIKDSFHFFDILTFATSKGNGVTVMFRKNNGPITL